VAEVTLSLGVVTVPRPNGAAVAICWAAGADGRLLSLTLVETDEEPRGAGEA
jgi:hypothetical protein